HYIPCHTLAFVHHNDYLPVVLSGLLLTPTFGKGLVNVSSANKPRFCHLHIALVGPLPVSRGFTYLLTMVDRFTRWPEVVPLQDATAETVALGFITAWVSRFGVPSLITMDQERQFESSIWSQLMRILGTQRIRTTAYHPIANGLVERLHCQLKAAIKCLPSPTDWVSGLP
uniref:Integrase catalytic domain-containing protein n=1 Tax=Amphimedon queenslandica TaxID=400682 RepID=A0A1X7TW34_AMPQE